MILPQITLPWAKTSELSHNARLHWAPRRRLVAAQKDVATKIAWANGWHTFTIPDGVDVKVTVTICPPSRGGIPDDDNVISAQKGALDALAEVLKINDRRFRLQAPVRGERCRGGAIIINAEVA